MSHLHEVVHCPVWTDLRSLVARNMSHVQPKSCNPIIIIVGLHMVKTCKGLSLQAAPVTCVTQAICGGSLKPKGTNSREPTACLKFTSSWHPLFSL